MGYILLSISLFVIMVFLLGIRIIRPTHRGAIETLGKYTGYRNPGFTWIIPIFQKLTSVNITERLANVDPIDMITKDNLNANVDLVVYYKIKQTEKDIKNALYNVDNVSYQIVSLAQTTARNIIGGMVFKDVNNKRGQLNDDLAKILTKETDNWGIEVVRVELKEITPPTDVQETMNRVIKAENEKDAALDFATAKETEADGTKRANIKEAEGIAQGKIIVAKAEAERIKLVNDAAHKHFRGNAVKLKQLSVTQASLEKNAKIILTDKGIKPQLIIGQLPIGK